MFELGMRLAFDKPTVVVKDDTTRFSFDTSPIQHLSYRRDLRFRDMRAFIAELAEKIRNTHKVAKDDPSYSPFVRSFGTFKLPEMTTETVGVSEYTADQLKQLVQSVSRLSSKISAMESAQSAMISLQRMESNTNTFAPGFKLVTGPSGPVLTFPNALQGMDFVPFDPQKKKD
jgi:hypothetical protein